MKFLTQYADNTKKDSITNKYRRKRFRIFLELLNKFNEPVNVIDIGGTANYWEQMGMLSSSRMNLTIINIENEFLDIPGVKFIKGSALDLSNFRDNQFDIAFSNSVIEHVGSFADQLKMANEMRRVGKKIYLQTPNYYFPFEPHFLFPAFQFFPRFLKIFLVRNFNLGWFPKMKDRVKAVEAVNSIKLLKRRDLAKLFPSSTIIRERLFGITKSHIVIS